MPLIAAPPEELAGAPLPLEEPAGPAPLPLEEPVGPAPLPEEPVGPAPLPEEPVGPAPLPELLAGAPPPPEELVEAPPELLIVPGVGLPDPDPVPPCIVGDVAPLGVFPSELAPDEPQATRPAANNKGKDQRMRVCRLAEVAIVAAKGVRVCLCESPPSERRPSWRGATAPGDGSLTSC